MAQPIPIRPKGVLLTTDDLRAWHDEVGKLVKERDEIEKQIGELEDKIGAAKELLDLITPRPAPQAKAIPVAEPESPLPLTDAIKQIVLSCGGKASYYAIKLRLNEDRTQAMRLKANPNYFYTAVKRLKERDIVIQDGTNLIAIEAKANEPRLFDGQETKNPATEVAGS